MNLVEKHGYKVCYRCGTTRPEDALQLVIVHLDDNTLLEEGLQCRDREWCQAKQKGLK